MKEKNQKLIAKTVGVAALGDPHFEGNTKRTPKACLNLTSHFSHLTSDHNGITLIALIITIIVMLILVGVTVNVAINGGLFSTAKQATTETQYQAEREMLLSAVIGAINDNAEVDYEKLDANLPDGFTGSNGEYTSKAGNNFKVDKDGSITELQPIQVTVDGKTETITPENVGKFLGKVVKNYTGKNSVTIGSETYKVSPEYRLYYVDFDNKYGDGEGTIYLKAECTGNKYPLQTTEPKETDAVKIEELNPGLYNDEERNPVTSPETTNNNMKAVTWLTNTNNWKDLKPETFSDGITEQDINYIVGAPSLEMMMDSYNTHYGLTGDKPDTTTLLEGTEARVKLFYLYPPFEGKSDGNGYRVGPSNYSSALNGYYTYTSNYSVKKDNDIGTMYYPGESQYYWLASPSADSTRSVMRVTYGNGGYVGNNYFSYESMFCPLVSLKSSVNLTLE